ncbi:MAG: D-alanine--D-alanine ligase [Hungatella sp.]|nr:D-alanine--D-alanine ligase [Hungatella sp.]
MTTKVAVLFGGKSVEHEVSIISAIQAIMSMDREKYEIIPVYITKDGDMYTGEKTGDIEAYKNIPELLKKSQRVIFINENGQVSMMPYPMKKFGKNNAIAVDVAFPIVHGTNEEDGTLQGYLKTVGLPFVGCDVTASALGMDKYLMKAVLKDNGVPVLDCILFRSCDYRDVAAMIDRVEEKFGYPVIVKPVNLGSSVGISVAKNKTELEKSIDDAYTYATRILVEPAIMNLREINCAVLGDENEAEASECEEPLHSDEILSYEDKYLNNAKGGSKGMASVSRKIPAELSQDKRKEVRDMAVKAFQCLGCSGVSRIDFMIDRDTDKLYLNEINTIPGSLAFYLWEPVGVKYTQLLDRMIQLAMKREREEKSLTYTFDTNILSQQTLSGAKGVKR